MKKFEPSGDFVSRVMRDVHKYENGRAEFFSPASGFFAFRAVRYAVSAGGLLLGIANLLRLYFSIFSPVLCR